MAPAFGTKFIILNDTQQIMNIRVFRNGPWVHLATIGRGLREYCVFKHLQGDKVFIEIVGDTTFHKIESDAEWEDVVGFCRAAGLLTVGVGKEIKVGKDGLPGIKTHQK